MHYIVLAVVTVIKTTQGLVSLMRHERTISFLVGRLDYYKDNTCSSVVRK